MGRRFFILGILCWLILLATGAYWSSLPYRWATNHHHFWLEGDEGRNAVRNGFTFRLTRLEKGSISSHSKRIENEGSSLPRPFNSTEWAVGETRARIGLVLVMWFATGFIAHGITGLILKDKLTVD